MKDNSILLPADMGDIGLAVESESIVLLESGLTRASTTEGSVVGPRGFGGVPHRPQLRWCCPTSLKVFRNSILNR